MKVGYYVAIIAGGGGPTVLFHDGEHLLVHGTHEPLDPGYVEFIATEPFDPMTVPGLTFTGTDHL